MSRETIEHLNTDVLIGNTDQRGHAWHYRAEEQGDESNHYPGAIPIEDVQRRLFHWEAASCRMAMEVPADFGTMFHLTAAGPLGRPAGRAGHRPQRHLPPARHLTDGYEKHQYAPWLLGNVGTILDDTLSISSAGLLKNGAISWVEVSVPESNSAPCDDGSRVTAGDGRATDSRRPRSPLPLGRTA